MRPSPALHGRLALGLFRACAGGRLFTRHAEFGERLIVELAARRNRPRELKLGESGLRLGAEIAVDRSCVEAEREQPLLYPADELRIRARRRLLGRVWNCLLWMQRRERAGCAREQRSE